MAAPILTPEQTHALFDILTHEETFAEIEKFKRPGALEGYGPPFKTDADQRSTSPILQSLLAKLALNLPGLKNISSDFWQVRCHDIVEQLGAAELSESYDKGVLTLRKTLATAFSAIFEALARGLYGGIPEVDSGGKGESYDVSDEADLTRAWNVFIQQLVYGDLIDVLFAKAEETDQLSDHSSLVQAAHEYILINVASFLYHTFVVAPDGHSLLRVIENVHRLVPYALIRQTLRVGNAASMINAMVKLLLAKLSVTSLTNWIGLSNSVDDGMNLLQQIVSTVLSWDGKELEKRATTVEQATDSPSKDHLSAIKAHVRLDRNEHEKRRSKSKNESKSIVTVIFEEADLSTDISDTEHAQALKYLSFQLSLHDRDELSGILCRPNPDHISQAIRDLVSAYDPIIRSIHGAVDLSATLFDFENFLNDLIKVSKSIGKNGTSNGLNADVPCVEDYINLLKKHQGASHRFIHQVAKKCKDITKMYQEHAHDVALQFRTPKHKDNDAEGAGAMSFSLHNLVSELKDDERRDVIQLLDAHANYLSSVSRLSTARMQSVLKESSKTTHAPGMYLARWHALLQSAPITPATAYGLVRHGKSEDVMQAGKVDIDGKVKGPPEEVLLDEQEDLPEPSNVELISKLLLPRFRKALAEFKED